LKRKRGLEMPYDPRLWELCPNGLNGRFAWNRKTRKRIELVSCGYKNGELNPHSFSDAINEFEKKIGPY
jgi:hypothetical protein